MPVTPDIGGIDRSRAASRNTRDDGLARHIVSGARYGALVAVMGMAIAQCAGTLRTAFLNIAPHALDAQISESGQLVFGASHGSQPTLNRVERIAAADLDGVRRFTFGGDQITQMLKPAQQIARAD